MNSRKVMGLMELLAKETSGHSEEIISIYKRALDEDDDVKILKSLINDYSYYHEVGNALSAEASDLLKKLYSTPLNAPELMPELKPIRIKIDRIRSANDELICSSFPTDDSLIVLKKKDIITYLEALRMIAGTCTYLLLVYGGKKAIDNLTWDDAAGIRETFHSINSRFLPALCAMERPACGWVIQKRKVGGKALLGGDCFSVTYQSEGSIRFQTKNLRKEAIGTHAYLNIDAFESREDDVPYCWGIGNLVSVKPNNALAVLQSDIVTGLQVPKPEDYVNMLPQPVECAERLSDGKPYCISPDELVLAMNRWTAGHEIGNRRRNHNCLFCGKYLSDGRRVCSSHFMTEFR